MLRVADFVQWKERSGRYHPVTIRYRGISPKAVLLAVDAATENRQ
jgi:hypothetical protein